MPTLTKLYSMEEASQHNTREDCWVVIDGKVYDVSTYLDDHPGGDDVLLGAAGKDATDEFEDAGHSESARKEMKQFMIGELDEMPTPIPEMEIVSKKHRSSNLFLNWGVPATVLGLSVAAGLLYLKKKQI